jgi:outer membrane protein OmpA-like peptidoglycan-associated protein
MNTSSSRHGRIVAAAVAAALLSACATVPVESDAARNLRTRLDQLQADPQLGTRAPLAMQQANVAVTAAEKPQSDPALAAHLEFIADRKISIAQADAQSQLAVDQRKGLAEQREAMRLRSRTEEADSANRRANVAEAVAGDQERQAEAARSATADAQRASADAQRASADAQRASDELQRQIDDLHAQATDRGLVLTLGDVLFASGTADLTSGGSSHLNKLAAFLNKYGDRTALIEGYTDSIGGDDYNLGLSQRRADSVKSYLVNQGVDSVRLTTSGKGKGSPVADNSSATGRQQNRRVEVIIENARVSER